MRFLFYYCYTKAFPCNQVRDIKIKFLGNLKQETEEDRSEWRKLCACLKVCELKAFVFVSNNYLCHLNLKVL